MLNKLATFTALKAVKGTGYAMGYATTTVKEEVAYVAQKVTKTISETKVAEEFSDGYYEGKTNAEYAFTQRCIKREEKARTKAAEAAAQELMDKFDDALCGDGEWCNA